MPAGHRSEEEDVSPVAGDHLRQGQPGHVQRGAQVDVDEEVDRVGRVRGEGLELRQDAGVVHDDVERDAADRGREGTDIANVERDGVGASLGRDPPEVVVVERERVDIHAAIAKAPDDGFADAARRTRHQRGPTWR